MMKEIHGDFILYPATVLPCVRYGIPRDTLRDTLEEYGRRREGPHTLLHRYNKLGGFVWQPQAGAIGGSVPR